MSLLLTKIYILVLEGNEVFWTPQLFHGAFKNSIALYQVHCSVVKNTNGMYVDSDEVVYSLQIHITLSSLKVQKHCLIKVIFFNISRNVFKTCQLLSMSVLLRVTWINHILGYIKIIVFPQIIAIYTK